MKKLQAMILGIICFAGAFYMFYFVSPGSGVYLVHLFIVLIGTGTYFMLLRFNRKAALIGGIFIASFLLMSHLAGFQIINTLLLVSVIIGVALLI